MIGRFLRTVWEFLHPFDWEREEFFAWWREEVPECSLANAAWIWRSETDSKRRFDYDSEFKAIEEEKRKERFRKEAKWLAQQPLEVRIAYSDAQRKSMQEISEHIEKSRIRREKMNQEDSENQDELPYWMMD